MDHTGYTYQPLDLATDAIRILRIFQGHGQDPIHCELIESLLGEDEGLQYEALSYTWGESGGESFAITLHAKKKSVTENLYLALHRLRKTGEDRWLWVDALCIDQENPKEKTHQVSHMRHIYEKADRVLVWLGLGTDDIDLLMGLMVELDMRVRQSPKYRKDEPKVWLEEWVSLSDELGGMQTELNNRRRNALAKILTRPWFERVWILQEVFSAKRASVICGWKMVPTETFVMMPRLMGINPGVHVESVLDIMPGCLRRYSWRSEEPDLRTLLRRFRASKATDPRDKIYALLGMSSDVLSDGALRPDYTVSLKQAIQDTIFYLTFRESPGTRLCELPDWEFDGLIRAIHDLPSRILLWALVYKKYQTLREILRLTDIDVNGPHTPQGAPLLYLADKPASDHAIQIILDYDGVNVNITDNLGDTPLNIAAREGNYLMVKALLERYEIEVNHIGREMQTPLEEAAKNRHRAVVEHLLLRGDVDVSNFRGIAPEPRPPRPATPEPPPIVWQEAAGSHDVMIDSASTSRTSVGSSVLDYQTICGRTFQNFKDAHYWQPNDERQNESLNINHNTMLWLNKGELFHAPTEDPRSVLDVGTGTGIWAIDIADRFPLAEVTGIDLSPIQPRWAPQNCKFELDDVSQDWAYGNNQFDFIHIRGLLGGTDSWERLYKQAYRCLKPGGWMEHAELSIEIGYDDSSAPQDCIYTWWNRLFYNAGKRMGRTYTSMNGGQHIKWMEAAGFTGIIHINECKVPLGTWASGKRWKMIGAFNQASWEQGLEGFGLYLGSYAMGFSSEELQGLFTQMYQSLRNPTYHPYHTYCALWVQKPIA